MINENKLESLFKNNEIIADFFGYININVYDIQYNYSHCADESVLISVWIKKGTELPVNKIYNYKTKEYETAPCLFKIDEEGDVEELSFEYFEDFTPSFYDIVSKFIKRYNARIHLDIEIFKIEINNKVYLSEGKDIEERIFNTIIKTIEDLK